MSWIWQVSVDLMKVLQFIPPCLRFWLQTSLAYFRLDLPILLKIIVIKFIYSVNYFTLLIAQFFETVHSLSIVQTITTATVATVFCKKNECYVFTEF